MDWRIQYKVIAIDQDIVKLKHEIFNHISTMRIQINLREYYIYLIKIGNKLLYFNSIIILTENYFYIFTECYFYFI